MKNKTLLGLACVLCALSGAAGAYAMLVLEAHHTVPGTLQARRLELTDESKHVRASFAVEDDGSVVLRMMSAADVPMVELGVGDSRDHQSRNHIQSGTLVIGDGLSTPVIQLGTSREGEGTLFFSSRQTRGQVAVGYQPYGDVVDGIDRGIWGIQVKGPDHETTGVGVYTENGLAETFVGPHKSRSGASR